MAQSQDLDLDGRERFRMIDREFSAFFKPKSRGDGHRCGQVYQDSGLEIDPIQEWSRSKRLAGEESLGDEGQ